MNIQQLEQQIDSTIYSLKQKFSKNNLKTIGHSMPCSATTSPIHPQKFNRTNSLKSIKSKNSFKKLFLKNRKEEEENNIWTAPVSPQLEQRNTVTPTTPNSSLSTNTSPNHKRRNSARLRELQRLLKAYHEQNSKWASEIKTKESAKIQGK